MKRAGIRELKQNASAVVAAAAAGQTVIITDRGRPVAQLVPLEESPLDRLRAAGRLQEARIPIADLPDPEPLVESSPSLSETLAAMRDDERR